MAIQVVWVYILANLLHGRLSVVDMFTCNMRRHEMITFVLLTPTFVSTGFLFARREQSPTDITTRGFMEVSERSERALRKTSILAMDLAKWLQTATSTTKLTPLGSLGAEIFSLLLQLLPGPNLANLGDDYGRVPHESEEHSVVQGHEPRAALDGLSQLPRSHQRRHKQNQKEKVVVSSLCEFLESAETNRRE